MGDGSESSSLALALCMYIAREGESFEAAGAIRIIKYARGHRSLPRRVDEISLDYVDCGIINGIDKWSKKGRDSMLAWGIFAYIY